VITNLLSISLVPRHSSTPEKLYHDGKNRAMPSLHRDRFTVCRDNLQAGAASANTTSPYCRAVGCKCKKTTKQRTICYLKTEKEKRNNEQPTHKTTHLQAPTHKQMLQLAKELFSCRRTQAHPPPLKTR
jgi:hypothetical protein